MNFKKFINSDYLKNNPLCGIDTYKDELNLATGACMRYVKKLVLTGQETGWEYYQITTPQGLSGYFRLLISSSTRIAIANIGMCSHYRREDLTSSNAGTDIFTINAPAAGGNGIVISPIGVGNMSVNDFKSYLATQYANGTPVTVWYVLATPTTETITVPSGLSGTEEGYLNRSGTPTPTNPIYPTANTVEKWFDLNHYIMGTATDTITTLPADIYANDTTATVGLKGQMVQSSTPTPITPIQPQECGERTGNLFNPNQTWYATNKLLRSDGTLNDNTSFNVSDYTEVEENTAYYLNNCNRTSTYPSLCFYDANKTYISGIQYNGATFVSFTTPQNCKYIMFSVLKLDIDIVMLNIGSTSLPYEPYGYKIPISSGGENLCSSQFEQGGFASSTGEPTESTDSNYTRRIRSASFIALNSGIYTISANYDVGVYVYDTNGSYQSSESYTTWNTTPFTFQIGANRKIKLIFRNIGSNTQLLINDFDNEVMLNSGSTALPYEPYNRTTTPVYLGEVQTTRKIKKLVLTGEETISFNAKNDNRERFAVTIPVPYTGTATPQNVVSSHLPTLSSTEVILLQTGICMRSTSNDVVVAMEFGDVGVTLPTDATAIVNAVKTYLQQQYANGTPVCVWYVLATPETGIVNEPLRKIGDYADEVSGVSIPTIAGTNTLSVDTTLQPSEVTATYKGWHLATSVKNYIHNGMDIITTLPVTISADGNAFVGLQGNMTQSSTPTPTTPIQPSECGERTGNLFDSDVLLEAVGWGKHDNIYSGYSSALHSAFNSFDKCIPVDAAVVNMNVMFKYENLNTPLLIVFWYTDGTKTQFSKSGKAGEWTYLSGDSDSNKTLKGVAFSYGTNDLVELKEIMVNTGSTALPYEPYGYKIPISSASTTTPVYLGEVETVRKIGKIVLDGTIPLSTRSGEPTGIYFKSCADLGITPVAYEVVCSHFSKSNTNRVADMTDNTILLSASTLYIRYTATNDINTWLASNPITVWYVLAESSTGIVNEPIRKIGGYADTIDNISIPTITGEDIIDVETTLKPSKMKIKYNSWHDGNISYLLADSPLCGIDTYKDTLNLADGSCTRQIKKIVLDETTVFTKGGSDDSGYFVINLGDSTGTLCVCSHFVNVPITASSTDVGVSITATSYNLRIRPENVANTTAEQFNQWIAEQYTNGTPVTVWYVLSTPTTETITVPTGLFGTEEGYLTQKTTPTATSPVYPTANGVPLLT